MNVCENEAVIAFDTLYTQNHIQILKILLPYFDPYGQSHLAVWIKYLELRYTLEYVSRHPFPSIQKSNLRHILAGLCRVV